MATQTMTEFEVSNMTCGHCASAITKAVLSADAGARVDVDLGAKRVRIAGSADAERYAQAIREAGYQPVQHQA
jgi:copper chaperone